MPDMVYTEFPHQFITANGSTTFSVGGTSSGKLHVVDIGNTLNGRVTISDSQGTIQVFASGIAPGNHIFDTLYAYPLVINLSATSGSDSVCVIGGPT